MRFPSLERNHTWHSQRELVVLVVVRYSNASRNYAKSSLPEQFQPNALCLGCGQLRRGYLLVAPGEDVFAASEARRVLCGDLGAAVDWDMSDTAPQIVGLG